MKTKVAKAKQVVRQVDMTLVIDEFGRLSELEKEIKEKKEALRKNIIENLGEGVHTGREFAVTISKREDLILNPVSIYNEIGLKKFLKVVKVSVTDARKVMSDDEIRNHIADRKETMVVSAKRK